MQSTDKQSREEWTKVIAEVIRDLEMIPESRKKVIIMYSESFFGSMLPLRDFRNLLLIMLTAFCLVASGKILIYFSTCFKAQNSTCYFHTDIPGS